MPDVLSTDLLLFIAVGFVAQIIDGALGRGHDPKKVIGSANLTEFAVMTVISASFILAVGWSELSAASASSSAAC